MSAVDNFFEDDSLDDSNSSDSADDGISTPPPASEIYDRYGLNSLVHSLLPNTLIQLLLFFGNDETDILVVKRGKVMEKSLIQHHRLGVKHWTPTLGRGDRMWDPLWICWLPWCG